MSDSRPRGGRRGWFFLSLVGACLASGTATAACTIPSDAPAGSVPCRIVVQPIDVCPTTSTSTCAPFNTINRVGNPNNLDQTTNPIGFIETHTDPVTNEIVTTDLTRAMLNQIGLDVTFLPIVKYNSPINPATNTTFQILNVVQDATNQRCPFPEGTISGFTSCDFLTLSQQPAISRGEPPNPQPPNAPVSSEPTVINMFFVNQLNPPASQPGGTLYGFSWINNNGVVIGKNTFSPPLGLKPRFDTLAHELLHNLATTHSDFGAGPLAPANLETAGCCIPGTSVDLRVEPTSPSDALAQLAMGGGSGSADQLTLTSQDPNLIPWSQQTEVLMSGFVRPVLDSMVTATQTTTGAAVAAAAVLSTNARPGASSHPNTAVNFQVAGPVNAASSDETLTALILALPDRLKFDPNEPFKASVNPQFVANAQILHGNNGNLREVCPPATDCLLVEFAHSGLQQGQFVKFSIGIRVGGSAITLDELAGGDITFVFGPDTFATTGALRGPVSGQLAASSQQPDLGIPSQYMDPSKVIGTGGLPCTPIHEATGCPDPTMTGIEDGDPSHEGGQLPHLTLNPS